MVITKIVIDIVMKIPHDVADLFSFQIIFKTDLPVCYIEQF